MKRLIATTSALALLISPAFGQNAFKPKTLQQINQDIKNDLGTAAGKAKAAVTGQPAPPSTEALPCMDIAVITKLTPSNLVPTFTGCEQDVIKQLVSDTSRALDSAKSYQSVTGGVASGATGDNDGINCLTPALALFQAAVIIPAVPSSAAVPAIEAQAAVSNPDGTIKTPAVAAVAAVPAVVGHDALKPGPVLLYQKFREFTLAGGLTSCPAWFNGPVNAVAAAGVAGVATATAGAALIIPKP